MRHAVLALRLLLVLLAGLGLSRPARAGDELSQDLAQLGSTNTEQVRSAMERLAARGDARALPALEALDDEKLRVDAAGHLFIGEGDHPGNAIPGETAGPSGALTTASVDNTLRRALGPIIAGLRLSSPDRNVRLAAVEEVQRHPSADTTALLKRAIEREKDGQVRTAFALVLAQSDLDNPDPKARLAAVETIRASGDVAYKGDMERLATTEADPAVKHAAQVALAAIQHRISLISVVGHLFYGLSLGSVLLLAALGLAITFGLMRVINMAHGEMLMLGAYATFSVQNFFQAHVKAHEDLFLLAAIPAAFALTFGVGVLLERTVIRYLYGRPLETLLATWGISLVIIQTVRLVYGAQNVTVENPPWLSGGYVLLPGVVLTWSRLAVIVFSALVVLFTWFVMNKTKLGLELRAVVQNREMASALGIATRRVDMWTFGIGSGIAGLGGVALSQLGNVGPELGQSYIVDSFMVVVLGGVGKLAGTMAGALGLGVANKLLEPALGAVLGKIMILGFIILFVQKRPQGIFALKGRFADAL